LPWLTRYALAVGLPFLGSACAGPAGILSDRLVGPQVVCRGCDAAGCERDGRPTPSSDTGMTPQSAPSPIRQVQATEPAEPGKVVRPLPITLDTVLRLAEEQNRQVALARERLHEACAEKNLAALAWVPNLYVGTSYYRHEGGIQAVNGRFVDSSFGALFNGLEVGTRLDVREATFLKISAERRVLQQKGELSKVTSETLLEAANTYIDLILARSSVAVAKQMEKYHADLLDRAQKLLKAEPGMQVQVEGQLAELRGHRAAITKGEQQAQAAAVKLAYLLGLDACVELVPVDEKLVPFDLINAELPTCQLVELALSHGPGVAELERLLVLIQSGIERMRGPAAMLPTLEMRMAEGGFGAGPGASLTWDNRWDLNLQMRWNLNGLAGAQERQRVAQSKLCQVHLTYQDLRGKLTAGVREAHDAIQSGREQMALGDEQIRHAQKAYELSHLRLVNNVNPSPVAAINEVLQTVRLLELAQLTQLTTIGAYDKAQLRLLVLLGPAYGCHPATLPPPSPDPLPPGGEGAG
jgi:outer membrane protein TolC